MKRCSVLVFLFLTFAAAAFGQDAVLARGNPALTENMVRRLGSVYETLLDIRLNAAQSARLRQGVVRYWTERDEDGINTTITNVKYYDSPAELSELRRSSQPAIVEGLRRDAADTGDQVSAVLVEAYDQAHPNMRSATRSKTFSDLVGTWKRQDALLADRDPYNGAARGVSFTDSGTLEIGADGKFALVKVHNHCSGGCCRLDGSEEFGTVSLAAGKLNFQTNKGSKLAEDGCLGKKQRFATSGHKDVFAWSIRTNPSTNAPTLCLSSTDGKADCFDKQ